jgi:hypothetical protein
LQTLEIASREKKSLTDFEQRYGFLPSYPNSAGRDNSPSKQRGDSDGKSGKGDGPEKGDEPDENSSTGQKRKADPLALLEGNSTPSRNRLNNHPFKTPFKSPLIHSSSRSPVKSNDTPSGRCRVSGMSRTPKRF